MEDMKFNSWKQEPEDADLTGLVYETDMKPKLLVEASNSMMAVDLRQYCSPVENQRQLSSCVGNAVVGALELLENLEGKPYMDLSRLFVYYNARVAVGDTAKDDGSYIRYAMESLSRFGVPTEAEWPYDVTKVFIRPSWNAYREAYGHKINAFYRIKATGEGRIAEIESALRSKHPVVFGAAVYEQIRSCTGHIEMPKGASLGGHAMLIVGFDSDNKKFLIRNSWGPNWGDGGYATMDYSYLDAANANDFWVPTLLSW